MAKAVPGMLFLALLFFINLEATEQAKILALFPVPGKSHNTFVTALAKGLAKKGHEVTVLSPFPLEKPIPNYREIPLKKMEPKDVMKALGNPSQPTNTSTFDLKERGYLQTLFFLWGMGGMFCDYMLAQEGAQNLMKSNEQYDLILLENFVMDCFIGFTHKFKAPLIQLAAFAGSETIGDLVGNPTPYAYVPDPFSSHSEKMNFKERVLNTVGQIVQKIGNKFYHLPNQDKIMRKHFNDPNMPYIEELEKKTALLFVNQHFSISYPRPMVPNFVQVGGMHINPPKKLPEDLQKFLDEAPHGVIYFSMGSNLRSADMSEETVQALIQAFSSMKQRILWKWEDDALPGQPKNLKIQKWLPQSDILAHPNVRMFITHGGLLSTQETINRGVPVLGIPIYGDQKLNMAKSKSMGFAIELDYANITKESVVWAVNEIIGNPKYRENAQRLSDMFRDQPLTPLETAVYWTEYIIRHNGAPHLRSAALDLTWYQYYLLDVITVLALAVGIVLLIPFLILRTWYKKCCGGSKSKPKVLPQKKRS